MDKVEFIQIAERKRSELRGRMSSSDLYVSEEVNVAVIGIQNSGGGSGHDSIFIVREDNGKVIVKTVRERSFRSGRLWPTGISKNGERYSYTVKDDSGNRYDCDDPTT